MHDSRTALFTCCGAALSMLLGCRTHQALTSGSTTDAASTRIDSNLGDDAGTDIPLLPSPDASTQSLGTEIANLDAIIGDDAGTDVPLILSTDASTQSLDTEIGNLDAIIFDAAPISCRSSTQCPDFYFCLITASITDCLEGPIGTCVRIFWSNCAAYAGCGCLHLPVDPCSSIPGTWCDTIPPFYGTIAGPTDVGFCAACLPKRDGGVDGMDRN
jgi:hypothetical protein